jgi:1-aminocyclopropane-1-carboxylate deaminase
LERCRVEPGYHFGGYARQSDELLDFMRKFYLDTGIPADFVYTGKLCFAALDLVSKGYFPAGSQLLVIHSGGLQGNRSLPPGVLNF